MKTNTYAKHVLALGLLAMAVITAGTLVGRDYTEVGGTAAAPNATVAAATPEARPTAMHRQYAIDIRCEDACSERANVAVEIGSRMQLWLSDGDLSIRVFPEMVPSVEFPLFTNLSDGRYVMTLTLTVENTFHNGADAFRGDSDSLWSVLGQARLETSDGAFVDAAEVAVPLDFAEASGVVFAPIDTTTHVNYMSRVAPLEMLVTEINK